MRRTWLAAATAAGTLALTASPALAQEAATPPGDCHGTFISAGAQGIGVKAASAAFGWTVQQAQSIARYVCGQTDNRVYGTPPKCEEGQATAAAQALARGDLDQWLFHLGALENCFLGQPAGPPL